MRPIRIPIPSEHSRRILTGAAVPGECSRLPVIRCSRRLRRQWHLRDDPGLYFWCLGEFDAAMLRLLQGRDTMSARPRLLLADDGRKILVFERAGLIFLFNFHADESVADFPVLVPPGIYRGLLDTDAVRYGGQGRIVPGQDYPVANEMLGDELVQRIRVYLPARTALVVGPPGDGSER